MSAKKAQSHKKTKKNSKKIHKKKFQNYQQEPVPQVPAENFRPEILAPAGNTSSALAAFAAGADAVYLGLKHFSARMAAENFSIKELSKITDLARENDKKVYLTFNTMLKPSELDASYRLLKKLSVGPKPHALIIQDPGMILLARDAGFEGELHLSTLANVSHPAALLAAKEAGADRVVLPREISLDEVQLMDAACPENLDLELFVHGAMCYCVSGRCWWSSYMGGKSGLRGRCVQPCRRVYKQRKHESRFFSCLDLKLSAATGPLMRLPKVKSWKIEGRKKSPHYVYHVVKAYHLLRDDPSAKKEADELIEHSLGRPSTGAHFFSLKAKSPNTPADSSRKITGSGFMLGKVNEKTENIFSIIPSIDLLPKDLLRVGHEDEKWHALIGIDKKAAAEEIFILKLPKGKKPKKGTPVYLIDRKDPEIEGIIEKWRSKLNPNPKGIDDRSINNMKAPDYAEATKKSSARILKILLKSYVPTGRAGKDEIKPGTVQGLWLTSRSNKSLSQTLFNRISWWLPPVIWPNEEIKWQRLIRQALRKGARHFVCNDPWQIAYFKNIKGLSITAGPFCNLANAAALKKMKDMGFTAAIVSPELGAEDLLSLPALSPIPLGIVLEGWWPMGISRHDSGGLNMQHAFSSPMKEEFWSRVYGQNLWIYPNWPLDLNERSLELEKAGYSTFINMSENLPRGLKVRDRVSEFNWTVDLL